MDFSADVYADNLLQKLRDKKQKLGYTDIVIARKSGVPLRTVQEIMSSRVVNPRIRTYIAIAHFLKG